VLSADAPDELPQAFHDRYRALLRDLGLGSSADVGRRCAEVQHSLPRIWEEAETIMAANRQIED
jgi:hypothetical protein